MPRFQRDFYLQGTTCLTLCLPRLDVVCISLVLSLIFMPLSQLVLVFQVIDDMSLFTPRDADIWPTYISTSPRLSLSLPEWRLSRYPSPKILKQYVLNCLQSLHVLYCCIDMYILTL